MQALGHRSCVVSLGLCGMDFFLVGIHSVRFRLDFHSVRPWIGISFENLLFILLLLYMLLVIFSTELVVLPILSEIVIYI